MFRSFRFRLVALSVLVSAVALLAFMWLAWTLIAADQQKRFDSELETTAARYAPRLADLVLRPNPRDDNDPATATFWAQIAADVPLYLLATNDGEILSQSSTWPADLPPAKFTAHALQPRGPDFGPRGGPDGFGGRGPDPNAPDNSPPPANPGNPPAPGPDGGPPDFNNPDPNRPDPNRPNNDRGPDGFGGPGRGFGRGGRGGPGSLARPDQLVLLSLPADNPQWRLAVVPAIGGVVVFARPLAALDAERTQVLDTFFLALPVALALIGIGAAFLANRAVAPIYKLSHTAEKLTAEALHERIPRGREDSEFARLIDVFNRMLDRLELSFEQARRFSQDAAHELNTPLAVLMGQIDQALHSSPVGSPEQQRFAILAEEVQHLRDIVRKLLLLARADRGALHPDFQSCDLAQLARECLDDVAAGSPGLEFSCDGETSLPIEGDPSLLRQILLNLLSNATKYNRPGGLVHVHLARASHAGQSWAALTVTNTGEPLSAENAAHIFDRFFRHDTVRTGSARGGLGLGLSLAREFARAHGGELSLSTNSADAIGLRLDLPVAR